MNKLIDDFYHPVNNKEFASIIEELICNKTVQEMKNYRQHYETTCFEHCYMVAYYCYLICKKYHLDYVAATRAAMLHDLFLYDWRVRQPGRKGLHAFTHGKLACENASRLFDLSQKEQDMILIHKYCATSETFEVIKSRMFMKKAFRYAYVFLSLLIIRL